MRKLPPTPTPASSAIEVIPRAERSASFGASAAALKKSSAKPSKQPSLSQPLYSRRLMVIGAGLATMLVAGSLMWWLIRLIPTAMNQWPVEKIVIKSINQDAITEIDDEDLQRRIDALQIKNSSILQLDLARLQASMTQLDWVREASVRRQFPSTILVAIESHKLAALWLAADATSSERRKDEKQRDDKQSALVNTYGEVFYAVVSDERKQHLPKIGGPEGASIEVLEKFASFMSPLSAIGRAPSELILTPRRAWQLTLDNGSVLQLGRSDSEGRLDRFVKTYPQLAPLQLANSNIDLRYQAGFTIRNVASANELKTQSTVR